MTEDTIKLVVKEEHTLKRLKPNSIIYLLNRANLFIVQCIGLSLIMGGDSDQLQSDTV